MRRRPETAFGARRWFKALVVLFFLLCLSGAVFTFRVEGASLLAYGLVGFSVLGTFAVAEVFRVRVALEENELVIWLGWRQRRYERSLVERVTWAAGSGVSVRLADGSWVQLPELGRNSQSHSNSIRAWIARTPKGAPSGEED